MRTESLNSFYEAALNRKECWGVTEASKRLVSCNSLVNRSEIDWEKGDENWGRLMHRGEVVLLLNAQIPLAFVHSNLCGELQHALKDCVTVPIGSFSSDVFSVSRSLIRRVVGRELTENVDYNRITIDDLWWATL